MSQWRRRVRFALLVLVVLSFVWGGVRLADPMPKSPEMRTVDGSDPPARIAYDAMLQTREGNYVYEVRIGNETDRDRLTTVRLDTADRRFETVGPGDWSTYGDESGTWHRLPTERGTTGGWRLNSPAPMGFSVFWNEEAVLKPDADVSVVVSDESTLVVRVEDTSTAVLLAEDYADAPRRDPELEPRASLTLVVDRDRGVLRRSVYRQSWLDDGGENATRRTSVRVAEYRRWGEPDVERPTGLPYGFAALLDDLRNACDGCREGRR